MEGLDFTNSAVSSFPADLTLDADLDYLPPTNVGVGTDLENFFDFMADNDTANAGLWSVQPDQGAMNELVQAGHGILTERASTPADEEILQSYALMSDLCVS